MNELREAAHPATTPLEAVERNLTTAAAILRSAALTLRNIAPYIDQTAPAVKSLEQATGTLLDLTRGTLEAASDLAETINE